MAITPIERLPGGPDDAFKNAMEQIVADILQIIHDGIPLCEITIKGYSENYQRDALRKAIRYACSRYNRSMVAGPVGIVDQNDFELMRRKDDAGKRHWYIRYKKLTKEE